MRSVDLILDVVLKKSHQLKNQYDETSTAHSVEHTRLLNMSSNSLSQCMHFLNATEKNTQFYLLSKSMVIDQILNSTNISYKHSFSGLISASTLNVLNCVF